MSLVSHWFSRREDMPPCVFGERVYLECGCSVYVGLRFDREPAEVATLAVPCGDAHRGVAGRFNDLMRWSLEDGGTDRELVDVCEELLVEAFAEAVTA